MARKPLDLVNDPVGQLLFKISMPSIVAMVSISIYNFIDIFWVSKVSPEAIAALTISFPLQIFLSAIGVGTGVGAGSLASRMLGAGKINDAHKVAGQSFFLSIFLGIVAIIIVFLFPDGLLKIFGTPKDVFYLTKSYLLVFVISTPFMFFSMIFTTLIRAEGKSVLSMNLIVIPCIVSAVLDPFLILGWGPFPELGIQGAAVACLIGNMIGFLAVCYVLFSGRSLFKIHWINLLPAPSVIKPIYQVGLPSFIMNITLSFVFLVLNHVLGSFGPMAIATIGLLFRVSGICMWVLFGIGNGVMPLVGFSFGAKLNERLFEVVQKGVLSAFIIGAAYTIFVEIFAGHVLSIFTQNAELLNMAVPALRMYIWVNALVGPIVVWISMFTGLGKGLTAMVFLVTRDIVLLIPLLFLFPLWFGINGIWIAGPISNLFTLSILYFWSTKEIRALRKSFTEPVLKSAEG